ncbi:hypothetical protein M758_UG008300 [Ceratodon purpureus]|nr:hypothetical protein M758_UG008300 [Ceratodon purpureus]
MRWSPIGRVFFFRMIGVEGLRCFMLNAFGTKTCVYGILSRDTLTTICIPNL